MVDKSVERSGAGSSVVSCSAIGSGGVSALPIVGTTAAGLSVAQLGAQPCLQQSMSSWLMPDEDDPIAQFTAGTANAGPEAKARDKASTIRAIRRRMAVQLGRPALTCNYGARTFVIAVMRLGDPPAASKCPLSTQTFRGSFRPISAMTAFDPFRPLAKRLGRKRRRHH